MNLVVKSNLTCSDNSFSDKPNSVLLVLNEEDIKRINDAILFLRKTNGVSVKIRKTGDLYFSNKNEQNDEFLNHYDKDLEWEESCEGLIIMLNSIYYTATNDYDPSEVLESEDLTESYPELSALFSVEQEQKVVGYYVYGTEECINFEETGKAGEHSFEQREFGTLEEKNQFEAGIEAALGWERVCRTSPEECVLVNGILTRK